MATTGSEPRLRKRDLFKAIGYEPHPGQVLVHRSVAARRVLCCGTRWGKSVCGAMEGIAALVEPRDRALGWLVAPSYDNAARIFERVTEVMQTHFGHRLLEASPRDNRVVVRNLGGGRSELRVKSADNPTALLGEALDFLIVDEATRLRRDVWEAHLSARLIDRQGWALLLSTPRGIDFFYELYRRGQRHQDGFESWRSPSSDNPHLSRELIESQRSSLPADVFAQEYAAEFLGEEQEPCKTCGCPDPKVSGFLILRGKEEPPRCPLCSQPVDENGHTVVGRYANGTPHLHTIRLVPTATSAELPGDEILLGNERIA